MNEDDPFRDNADLIRAIEDAPPRCDIAMPPQALFKLERARRDALARSGVCPAADQHSLAQRQETQRTTQTKKGFAFNLTAARRTPLLAFAATVLILAALTWLILPSGTPMANVALTSPAATISDTQPVIAWTSKDKPDQKYDVWILPAEGDYLKAPTLFIAKGVKSPVAFASMKPGKDVADTALKAGIDYRVLICLADAGRMAGVPVTFTVKPPPAP